MAIRLAIAKAKTSIYTQVPPLLPEPREALCALAIRDFWPPIARHHLWSGAKDQINHRLFRHMRRLILDQLAQGMTERFCAFTIRISAVR